MVRAAILGLGRWGRSLVTSVQGKSGDIRFVLGHTRTREKAEDFCRDKDIQLVDSFEEILRNRTIDAVVLATPHSQHEAQIKQTAAAGKHIFVEKPITLDRTSAQAAVAAASKAGVKLAVGFCRRFHPSIGEVRHRLKDGRLGRLVALVGQHTTSTGAFIASDNWRADPREAPAGAVTAVGVHLLDHMIEFAGKVHTVHCVTQRIGNRVSDDTTTILMQFDRGVTGVIFCSVATATDFSFTIFGSKGLAEISGAELQTLRCVPASKRAPDGPVTAPPAEIRDHSGFDMLNAELTEFARCIRENTTYPVSIAEVLHGMSVFDALVCSAKSKRIVAVAEPEAVPA